MGFEIYTKEFQSKSLAPMIAISPLGRCSLNRAAAEMFDKDAVQTVLLLWDKDGYRFAIRPIAKKDPRSFNVRYTRKDKLATSAAFSGVMFLKHIGYDFTETKSYPIRWNAEEAHFEVELPKERFGGVPLLVPVEGGKKHAKGA
jgi:hypothetical protein